MPFVPCCVFSYPPSFFLYCVSPTPSRPLFFFLLLALPVLRLSVVSGRGCPRLWRRAVGLSFLLPFVSRCALQRLHSGFLFYAPPSTVFLPPLCWRRGVSLLPRPSWTLALCGSGPWWPWPRRCSGLFSCFLSPLPFFPCAFWLLCFWPLARVIALVTLKIVLLCLKRMMKMIKG